jgi:hypothetical protein
MYEEWFDKDISGNQAMEVLKKVMMDKKQDSDGLAIFRNQTSAANPKEFAVTFIQNNHLERKVIEALIEGGYKYNHKTFETFEKLCKENHWKVWNR